MRVISYAELLGVLPALNDNLGALDCVHIIDGFSGRSDCSPTARLLRRRNRDDRWSDWIR